MNSLKYFLIILSINFYLISNVSYCERYINARDYSGYSPPGISSLGVGNYIFWNSGITWYLHLNAYLSTQLPNNDAVMSLIDNAYSQWESAAINCTANYGGLTTNTYGNDGQNVHFWVSDPTDSIYTVLGPPGSGRATAVAYITVNSLGVIIDADVIYEGYYRHGWNDGGYYDIWGIALHELGHCIGLHHSEDPNAVMYNDDSHPRQLTQDDIAGARFLFDHEIIESQTLPTPGWGLSLNFFWSITIPDSVTVSIQPGTRITFTNMSLFNVYGTLNAQGQSSSTYNIIFRCTSGTWEGIKFNSGSSGTLSYCTIQNAQYGIYCNGYLPNITNCTIENNYIGINLYNTGVQTNNIANNTIRNNTTYGINMTYSSPRNIYGNEIYGNGQAGMYCSSNSIPYIYENEITDNGAAGITFLLYSAGQLGNSGSRGYNLITGNTWGVGCGYESDVIIGTTSQCGYNSIHDNSSYEVTGEYDSHVMAENNWWNRTPPAYPNYYYTGDFYTQMGGTIDYIPALTSDPLGGLMKITSYGVSEQNNEVAGVQSEDSFVDSGLRDALSSLLEGKYEEAITKYEKRFKEETSGSKRKYILRRISDCYNLSGKRGFTEHLNNELMVNKTRDNELYATAAAMESLNLISEKRYEEAIRNIEKLKGENPDNETIEKFSLYNLISLYKEAVNNEGKVREYYAELRGKYPGDEITKHIGILLGEYDGKMNYEVLNKEENTETYEIEKGYEITNYPNPFNPTTVISYQLPEKNFVTLKVYDILGKEVATLVNEYKEAGNYSVEFSADKYQLSSGIYFYTLKAGKNYVVKKMILMK